MKPFHFVCLVAVLVSGAAFGESNPVPLVSQPLVPTSAAPGSQGFVLTVKGAEFVSGAVINWNGSSLPTTFVNHDQLTAQVPSSDISTIGTASITVTNPSPGGGTSNSVPFTITSPTGSLTSIMVSSQVGPTPWGGVAADFSNDGKPDMAIVDGTIGSSVVAILLGNGDGTFSTKSQLTISNGYPVFAAAGDFNQDGKQDLVVLSGPNCMGCAEITIFLGNGDGTFTNRYESPGLDGNYYWVVAGDFNGDGKLDLAVSYDDFIAPDVVIYLGNGDGTFTQGSNVNMLSFLDSTALVAGDFNGDGILDLASAAVDGGEGEGPLSIYLGNGDGTFAAAAAQPVTTLVAPQGMTTGDFDGDGILDLAFADASGSLVVLHGNGDGTFTQVAGEPFENVSNFISTVDANGDGKLDLVLTSAAASTASVYLGNGNGTFQNMLMATVKNAPIGIGVGDFNGDGRLDLAIANSASTTVSVLLQSGVASLSQSALTFGNQTVGTTSAPMISRLTNNGSADLNIAGIAIMGANGSDFAEKNNCGTVVPPGNSCKIAVTFTPSGTGPRTASLAITDNAYNSPQTIALSGTGVGAPR